MQNLCNPEYFVWLDLTISKFICLLVVSVQMFSCLTMLKNYYVNKFVGILFLHLLYLLGIIVHTYVVYII